MVNPGKLERILKSKSAMLKQNPNVLGFYLIGSMANGTATNKSDIDIEIIYSSRKNYKLIDEYIDGVKIGLGFDSISGFIKECDKNPQNAYILLNSKILYDPKGIISYGSKKVRTFFRRNPQIIQYWEEKYSEYKKLKKSKKLRKTYFDVVNELNKKIKRKEILIY